MLKSILAMGTKVTLEIERRKRAHIDAVLNEDVTAKGTTTGFERLFFEHVALPEIDFDDIKQGAGFLENHLLRLC